MGKLQKNDCGSQVLFQHLAIMKKCVEIPNVRSCMFLLFPHHCSQSTGLWQVSFTKEKLAVSWRLANTIQQILPNFQKTWRIEHVQTVCTRLSLCHTQEPGSKARCKM